MLITKIKNEKREIITSRKGIDNVFGEFYKKYMTTMNKKNLNKKSERVKMRAASMCTTKNTNEMTRIPEITTEELRTAIKKLKKDKSQTATEQKTSKHATLRREKW